MNFFFSCSCKLSFFILLIFLEPERHFQMAAYTDLIITLFIFNHIVKRYRDVNMKKVYKKHGFSIRWLLISFCAHMEYIRHFDLLKVFGYIERVVKLEKKSKKTYFVHTCACSEPPSYNTTMKSRVSINLSLSLSQHFWHRERIDSKMKTILILS